MSHPSPGRRVAGWVGAGMTAGAAGLARGAYGAVRWPDHRLREVQRRTMRTLVVSQALGGLGTTLGIAVAALLAEQITGSDALAGLAQTMLVLGVGVLLVPARLADGTSRAADRALARLPDRCRRRDALRRRRA